MLDHGSERSAGPCPARQDLVCRNSADGSFSLWSETFREGFHSSRGALREARETFLIPSELERFPTGSTVTVLEVCVGTGSNLAVLLEACDVRGLRLNWIGLELDPEPLRLALSQPAFRAPWQTETLAVLEQLLEQGEWHGAAARPARQGAGQGPGSSDHPLNPGGESRDASDWPRTVPGEHPAAAIHRQSRLISSRARLIWGDARQTLPPLLQKQAGQFDLIWHDAFSPQRCPPLWTVEFLTSLTGLLRSDGRWISYCSAAAVRETLRLSGLQLAALRVPATTGVQRQAWSGGTLASPTPLPDSPLWRALTPMEQEHLACGAGEPYRDPTGSATTEEILALRQQHQAMALADGRRGSSSAWRQRWDVGATRRPVEAP